MGEVRCKTDQSINHSKFVSLTHKERARGQKQDKQASNHQTDYAGPALCTKIKSSSKARVSLESVLTSSSSLGARFKMVVAFVQTFNDLSAVFGQFGLSYRGCGPSKEARSPLYVPGFSLGSFLALSFFEYLLLGSCFGPLLAENSIRNALPELS